MLRFRFWKRILLITTLFVIFFSITSTSSAAGNSFVSIVNPIRGNEFWSLNNATPFENVNAQMQVLTKNNLSVTWLLRFDALGDEKIISIIKERKADELGIFMEVTPSLAKEAGVSYNQGSSWHDAASILLTGYESAERQKLIDTVFAEFQKIFGFYPKSVGAWWIDSFSINYMREKYEIDAVLNVADQFSTDNYQVWGQYWSSPFYPAKFNALIPAQNLENKLDVVITQWAARDPYNGYGRSSEESTYSVQANDYTDYHNLGISYFQKLADIYLKPPANQFGQLTIGLENDYDWQKFGPEYEKQLQNIKNRIDKNEIKLVNMQQFSLWYKKSFSQISPPRIIYSPDILGSTGGVLWYMAPNYRVGWFFTSQASVIRDLRTYDNNLKEPCYATRCATLNLAQKATHAVDEVTFYQRFVIDEGRITSLDVNYKNDGVIISYRNEAGKTRQLEFNPNNMQIDGEGTSISQATQKAEKLLTQESSLPQSNEKFPTTISKVDNSRQIAGFTSGSGLFMLLVVFLFYIPGRVILEKLVPNLNSSPARVFSLVLGMVIFTLLAYLSGFLHLRGLTYVVIAVMIILYFKKFKLSFSYPRLFPQDIVLIIIVIVGIFSQSILLIKSGWLYDYGLGFWGANGHDATWHLALISELSRNFPPQNPALAGIMLKNYHYFSDLLMAEVVRLWPLSPLDVYFRFFPILFSGLLGLVAYFLARKWFGKKENGILAAFFVYFAGSFGWIPTLFREHGLGGESMFWSFQSVSLLLNPPLIMSFLMLLAGIYFLIEFFNQSKWRTGILVIVLFGSIAEFKIYGAIIVLFSLGMAAIFSLVKEKNTKLMRLFLIACILSALVFLPNNWGSSSLLIFQPWWFVQTVTSADRLNWTRLDFARQAYQATNNWVKFIGVEALAFSIFLLGNLGMRFIGFGTFLRKPNFSTLNIFTGSFLFISLLLPLLFVQKTTLWNTIQFFYYFIFIFNFLAAAFIWKVVEGRQKLIRYLILIIIITLTIPTTISSIRMYFPDQAHARISQNELAGLNFLKKQPQGTVLVYPYNESIRKRFNNPYPIFTYESTAYVAAFSGQRTFIEDEMSPDLNETYFKKRLVGAKEYFRTRDYLWAKQFVHDNNIKYVYLTPYQFFPIDEQKWGLKKIFENNEVKIYKTSL